MVEERMYIKTIIESYLRNKDFCDGCIFLRSSTEGNHYGDDISSCCYERLGVGYQCWIDLTLGTLAIGYSEQEELNKQRHTLRRKEKCKNTSLRTTQVIEELIHWLIYFPDLIFSIRKLDFCYLR